MKKFLLSFISLYCCNTSIAQYEYEIFVSDRGNDGVRRYDLDGNLIDDFVSSGSGGLIQTEDMLFHPDGSLLVTGVGNNAIKRFSGTNGLYLGDFSTGYFLNLPSKMSLGPDSLIYVTQWGGTSKVVRFDLDGNFVDEFTSVSIPNALDHLWDADTNFYISCFGSGLDGYIHKFDKDGNDLGVFISSVVLQGPTSIWNDVTGDFLVADWTTGQVHRFDNAGLYENIFVTGLTNPEGMCFLPNGDFLLGDWGEDAVHRLAPDGTSLGYFTSGLGLTDPNSVILRHNLGAALDEFVEEKIPLQIVSGENNQAVVIQVSLDEQIHSQLVVFDAQGNQQALLFDQVVMDEQLNYHHNLAPGIYFISLINDKSLTTVAFFVNS